MNYKRFDIVRIVRRLLPLIVVGLLSWLIISHVQNIHDFARLYDYAPPIAIEALADQTTMSDSGRKLFYVNHPQIADRSSFNGACNSRGEQTIVLGCYHSVDRGIYLFQVTDTRLKGVEQVTAAHEMLHAAYDRLSGAERAHIDNLLQNFYMQQVTDKRIRDTIAAYKKSEPNDVVNEMHSIFATEIPVLTPELDAYYARYFTDRTKVVDYAANYQQEFSLRQDKVKTYDLELLHLKDTIDKNTATLGASESEINTMQRQMESDRSAGNVEAYNARVPAFNARVDQYNALIRSTQDSIKEYNRLVAERNALALEIRALTQSISSQFSPIAQ